MSTDPAKKNNLALRAKLELAKLKRLLQTLPDESRESVEAYGAQQALTWLLDPKTAMSASRMVAPATKKKGSR